MRILVINIALRPLSPVKLFPVGLGYIITAIKNAGFQFDLLDIDGYRYTEDEVEKRIQSKQYDVICMGCIVTGYRIIKDLCAVIKNIHPNSIVIIGNSVATSIVETLLTRTKADVAVMGEGDETIVDLLRTISNSGNIRDVQGICFLENGRVIRTPLRPLIKNISDLPFIDFSLFDTELYITNACTHIPEPLPIPRKEIRALLVNTARGCIARCTFCYHIFDGMPYRFRNVGSILTEVRGLIDTYNINYIIFSDELTFFSKNRAREFSKAILDKNLHFYWRINCRGNLFDRDEDIEIIHMMKQAGCLSIGYSLESADREILKAMNKRVTAEEFSRQTQLCHKAGMQVYTSIVLGYPQENPETIKKTFDCCIENNIFPSTGYLLPQPGSKMYVYAVENGFIKDEEEYLLLMGDRQDLRLNMTKMTDEEFQNHVLDELKRCKDLLGIELADGDLIKVDLFFHEVYSMDSKQ
jgi:anaerobic magnesium-protoporphyrin IX monomethyl ester cyclase